MLLILKRYVDVLEIVLFFTSGFDDWDAGLVQIVCLLDEFGHFFQLVANCLEDLVDGVVMVVGCLVEVGFCDDDDVDVGEVEV